MQSSQIGTTELINRTKIRELLRTRQGPCVSVFKSPTGSWQELLRDAERQLARSGDAGSCRLREQLSRLGGSVCTAGNCSPAVALFAAPDFGRGYFLPSCTSDSVVLSNAFHFPALLPMITANGQINVVELWEHSTGLYWADRTRVVELFRHDRKRPIQNTPRQKHITAGDPRDSLRAVDLLLDSGPGEQGIPVVLAGLENLCTLFCQIGSRTYPVLSEMHFTEAPSHERIAEQAWTIALPYVMGLEFEAADRYYRLWHSQRASNDPQDIRIAARLSRVETLFLDEQILQPNPGKGSDRSEHTRRSPETANELLMMAAIETFAEGGDVYFVPPKEVPGRGVAASVFRY